MTNITIYASDDSGSFSAYVAKPASGTGPVVIALQEIFGVNAGMREICDKLSEQGFIAISPDLFWRQEAGIELTDQSEEEWAKAFELYNGFDVDKGLEDIAATIKAARTLDGASGKVGAVGYCLGGLLAYLTATRTDIDASVGYYGVGIAGKLDEAKAISAPLMLHIAGKDEFVPADQQADMHKGLNDHAQVTLYDYPNRDHAFARPNGIHEHKEDAADANARTAQFFKEHLS